MLHFERYRSEVAETNSKQTTELLYKVGPNQL